LSEKRVKKYVKGHLKFEWVKDSGARNEPLDTLRYAIAALEVLNPNFEALKRYFDENKSFYGEQTEKRPVKKKIISRGIN
jgi:phage terminase large subunit GpA-like protein